MTKVVCERNKHFRDLIAAMPRKKDRGPRSVMENSEDRHEITCVMIDGAEAVKIISST